MIKVLNQPNNKLVNRLGLGAYWKVYKSFKFTLDFYNTLNTPGISYLIKIMIKSGIIYTHHPFFHKFYRNSILLISLPAYITEYTFAKFYRNHTIKLHYDKRFTVTFQVRNFLSYLNITNINVYKVNNYLVFIFYIFYPKKNNAKKYKKKYKKNIQQHFYNFWLNTLFL